MFNLDPHGTQMLNGVKVPVILCHADSNKLGLGSNHGDVLHWFKKHGKTMEDVRNDVAALLKKPIATTRTLYRIRKDWNDPTSQVGAFYNLESAKETCDTVGSSYSVFDDKGKVVYPVIVEFKDGDQIKLSSDVKYISGKSIPSWVLEKPIYFRGKDDKGNIKFSILKTGAITGVVERKYVSKVEVFKPYLAQVITNPLNIRKGAGINYSIIGKITNKGVYTIIEESNGQGATKWGLLKSHEKNRDGWIALDYTKKLS